MPYFAATLTAYLRESHPELLSDKHFIAERSDHAAQTYERAVRNGNSVYEALELSNAVLYQDLRFSKYDAIFEVVSEWFPEVAARQRTAFCLKLLPVCEEAFEMYDLTDDFESSPSYKNLLLELPVAQVGASDMFGISRLGEEHQLVQKRLLIVGHRYLA